MHSEDRIVNTVSAWLAGHVGEDELAGALERADPDTLAPGQVEAVQELRSALDEGTLPRPALNALARETLEAVALGD